MKTSRLRRLVEEYGPVAFGTYFAIFALVWGGFVVAIRQGLSVGEVVSSADLQSGSLAQAGLWGSAWVATKLTQPLRIVASLALTPVVAAALRRLGWRPGKDVPGRSSRSANQT